MSAFVAGIIAIGLVTGCSYITMQCLCLEKPIHRSSPPPYTILNETSLLPVSSSPPPPPAYTREPLIVKEPPK